MTGARDNDSYNEVVNTYTVRTYLFFVHINELDVADVDVWNVYPHEFTKEKMYMKERPEFGEWECQVLMRERPIYSLKTSTAMWNEELSGKPKMNVFTPSNTEPYLCI